MTYAKAVLPALNTFNGLQGELLLIGTKLQLYLNALSLQIPYLPNDEMHAGVTIAIEDQEYYFIADRFEGGQKVLLSDDALQIIINALLEGYFIDISIGRYETTLSPDNFACVYYKMT